MVLPIRPNNPNIPIPNTTFSSPLNAYVNGPYFPVVMGTGIDVSTGAKVADLNNQGVLEFSGATGDINLLAGTGISVVETTVGNNTDFTIANTGVTSLVAGSNITLSASSGTVTISAASGPGGTVTSVGTGVGLTGGPITSSGTISLDVSGVTPGSYTYPSITVDAYGRITVASNGTAPVTAITGTAPVQVTGTAPTLNVAIAPASTSAPGAVQLNDTTTSTSTTQALTANQGKLLQDQINAISVASNITLAGTLDASTGNLTTVTAEGTAAGFAIGSPLPSPAAGNDNYFVIASVAAASYTPPGGSATQVHVGDWFLSDAASWQFLDVGDSSGGTVTSVATTAALTGGPITTSGTLDLAVTGVTAGTVNYPASVTVDACGRITALGAATNPVTEADFQAKGDLIAGFGVNSYGVVGVGSNGQMLTANSSCAGGMEWVTPAAGAGSATPTVEGLVFGCTDTTNFNYGLGDGIFGALTTGTLNIAIGSSALASTDTGTSNTAVGIGALYSTTSGTQNVALGQQALFSNVSGGLNVAVGSNALQNTTGDANTALGNFAGNLVTTGCSNILIGNQAGGAGAGALDTGNNNVVIGNCVSPASNSADCQLAIGVNTVCWLTGDSTGAIKPGAGVIDCANSCGTAGQVLMSDGANAICWGSVAAPSAATPTVRGTVFARTEDAFSTQSTGLGQHALKAVTTGYGNTALGWRSGCALTTGSANTFVGENTFVTATSSFGNTAVGDSAGNIATGNDNVFLGLQAGYRATGSCNTFVGTNSVCGLGVTGAQNVAIGYGVCLPVAAGNCQLVIGYAAGQNWITGDSTKAIKPGAGIIDCAGSCGTAGQVLSSNGSNAIEWITAGGGGSSPATPSTEGTVYAYTDLYDAGTPAAGNAALGNGAGAALTTSDLHNTIIGSFAGSSLTGVTGQTALGFGALAQATTPATPGEVNLALGYLSGFQMTTGGNNILIGQQAGLNYTTESGNIIIGNSASGDPADAGIIRIGHGSQTAYIQLDAGGAIDISGSTAGTTGQVLTSAGPNQPPTWATPAGGSPFVDLSGGVASTTNGTKINLVGWPNEDYRNYIGQFLIWVVYSNAPGNPMYFMGSNAIIMLNSYNGPGSSTVQAMSTSTGTFAVESVLYPAYSDVTVTYTPTVSTSNTNFYIQYLPMVNGSPAINYLGSLYPLP
jgi:hypothetical protein